MIKNFLKLFYAFSLIAAFIVSTAYADEQADISQLANEAEIYFMNGQYAKSIDTYDQILETAPDSKTYTMKGIALHNLRFQSTLGHQPQSLPMKYELSTTNKLAMIEFYKALEIDQNNVIALNGMGLGFGSFGEYEEAKKYFVKALKTDPNNTISKNYVDYLEKIEKKFPYEPTEKPAFLQKIEENKIPLWIKNNAVWWTQNKITDSDFMQGVQYLVEKKIINPIVSDTTQIINPESTDIIPNWVRNNAKWWSAGLISDQDFLAGIGYLIENGLIILTNEGNSEVAKREMERTSWNFERYLINLEKKIKDENKYIEYPNPSAEVIKKYVKDYQKYNYDNYLKTNRNFPDREVTFIDDVYYVEYLYHIADQPASLPQDHMSTLQNSLDFWEAQEWYNTADGKVAKVKFTESNTRSGANVWLTWVVRNLGENVLGHAQLGKGVVEVALGGFGCDGSFQLYTVGTVEKIMTHELGHSLGLGHANDVNNMMYPTLNPDFSYCLIN